MDVLVGFDPFCGARLHNAEALKVEVRGEIRWFCSKRCARLFAETPWRFEDEEYIDREDWREEASAEVAAEGP